MFLLRLLPFRREEVFVSLSRADDAPLGALDQHLRRSRAGVVLAAHGEAVRPGGEHRQQVAATHHRQRAVLGQEVRRFAYPADHVHLLPAGSGQVDPPLGPGRRLGAGPMRWIGKDMKDGITRDAVSCLSACETR